eukprot:TRINITY_DN33901_c0_g1_i1.p1 TRINITY_DN33901_c0_g1~~TRINITY_DN33901_c0_g1_i1.p1  ORF type:complete len:509 (-),score=116.74 TRINITY_DN33901_c0_g1_i1:116-1642(-)
MLPTTAPTAAFVQTHPIASACRRGRRVQLIPAASSSTRPRPRPAAAAAALPAAALAGSAAVLAARRRSGTLSRATTRPQGAAVAQDRSDSLQKVVFMGDSVLDNFYWLQSPERPLRVQLEEMLRTSGQAELKKLNCVNLAVDQMTTFDFVERRAESNSWRPFAEARRRAGFLDDQDKEYITDDDGSVIRSVENLRRLDGVRWVVLSLGGNDVYLNKEVQSKLIFSMLPTLESNRQEVAEEFGKRYRAIVEDIRKAAPEAQLILVVPYQPHQDFSLVTGAPINDKGEKISGDVQGDLTRAFERQNLPDVVTPLVKEILTTAQEVGCPVIDLSQTLDPECEAHYGTGQIGSVNRLGAPWSGAEPSDVSSGFIAKLLAHAIKAGPKQVLYRGLPRQGDSGWSIRIKEEANDWMLVQDYRFGGNVKKAAATRSQPEQAKAKELDPLASFGVGVALVLLLNVPRMLQGQDPLFFDRSSVEQEMKEVLDDEIKKVKKKASADASKEQESSKQTA